MRVLGENGQESTYRIMPMKCEDPVDYNSPGYYMLIAGYGLEMDSINNVMLCSTCLTRKI